MYHYLAEHPAVFMADRKEIHFFGKDLTLSHRRPTPDEYLALFKNATGFTRIGEASVWYLMSKSAPLEIAEFQPDARILIMLRNPFEALYSLHSEMLCNGNENIEDFQQALLAEPDRRANVRIPETFLCREGLFYREIGRFADQVERYFATFGRERVQIILFDDFRRDTPEAYRRVLRFLGVSPDFAPEFKVYNASKRAKNPWLQRYVFQTRWARSFRIRKWIPRAIRDASWKLRVDYQPRPPMSRESFDLLAPDLIPQIDKLEQMLDRDLAAWRRPPSE
jgi:hypothetical protein